MCLMRRKSQYTSNFNRDCHINVENSIIEIIILNFLIQSTFNIFFQFNMRLWRILTSMTHRSQSFTYKKIFFNFLFVFNINITTYFRNFVIRISYRSQYDFNLKRSQRIRINKSCRFFRIQRLVRRQNEFDYSCVQIAQFQSRVFDLK